MVSVSYGNMLRKGLLKQARNFTSTIKQIINIPFLVTTVF